MLEGSTLGVVGQFLGDKELGDTPGEEGRVHILVGAGRPYRDCILQRKYIQQIKYYQIQNRLPTTVWKFRDYSITQILREINFGGSRSSKSAIFFNFRGSEND